MFKEIFRKITGKPADSFDRVNYMTTRKLPIPDLDGTDKFVQFIAKRTKQGYWEITSKNNVKIVTDGFQKVQRAFPTAVNKHLGAGPTKSTEQTYNFDTAFLILKEMEEALLKYDGAPLLDEPNSHYMAAYRLLPRQFQEGLDDLFISRTEKSGEVLPPKNLAQRPQTAHKAPKGAKPN